jgi:hypothetical protein
LGFDFLGLIGSSERANRDEMPLGLGVGLDSLRDLCAAKGMSTPEQGDAAEQSLCLSLRLWFRSLHYPDSYLPPCARREVNSVFHASCGF